MKRFVKQVLHQVFPKFADEWQVSRTRRHIEQLEASMGLPQLQEKFLQRCERKVHSGVFEGMRYVERAAGSTLLPKLIGSYELEVSDILQDALGRSPSVVVDVGCAEGYYAVGVARQLPDATVYAFDIDSVGRELCAEMARKNGVEARVHVRERCAAETLRELLPPNSFVISDCEGYEQHLLDPVAAPPLKTATILVELHDDAAPGVTQAIQQRFQETHFVTLREVQERNPDSFPLLSFLNTEERALALSEFRHGDQRWAFLTPK